MREELFFSSTPSERLTHLQNISSCSLSTMKILSEKKVVGDNTIHSIKNYYGTNIENINIKYDETIFSSVSWIKPIGIFDNVKLSFNCKYRDNVENKQQKWILEIARTDGILIKDLIVFVAN